MVSKGVDRKSETDTSIKVDMTSQQVSFGTVTFPGLYYCPQELKIVKYQVQGQYGSSNGSHPEHVSRALICDEVCPNIYMIPDRQQEVVP